MSQETLEKIVLHILRFKRLAEKTDPNFLTPTECELALGMNKAFGEITDIIEEDLDK